jgi:uncharacterized repeat protein (TIGR01451 family)
VATTGGGTYIDLSVPTLTVTPKDSFVTSPNVTPGGDMTYAMTVKNTGTGDATNVEVKDVLPVGVVFESVTADHAFSCSATGGNPANGVGPTVDCTGGTILGTLTHVGCCDVANISITAAAPQQTDTTLLDQATVNPTNVIPESDYSNNSTTVSNKVESAIDLSIGSYSSSSCSQNNNCDYTATVTNTAANGGSGETAGSPPIANVQVHFTMPVGVIIEAVTPTGGAGTWSCQTQQNPVNVVDCVGLNMQAGGSESIDITVFDTTSASLANQSTVTVNPNGTIVESDQSNDTNDSMTA